MSSSKPTDRGGRFSVVLLAAALVAMVAGGLLVLWSRLPERPTASTPSPAPASPKPVAFQTHIQPILAKYCFTCHGPEKQKAKLDLSKFPDEKAILGQRKLWKRVWDMVRAHEMPPDEAKIKPAPGERDFLVDWIEEKLNAPDPSLPRDPGRVVLRRLNRVEYRNTIHDLIGVDFDPTKDFPSDDVGYGFDNIGDVLTIPPLLMEKYLAAAEKILERAIVTPDQYKPDRRHFEAESMQMTTGGSSDGDVVILFANGEIFTHVDLKQDGQYLLRVRAGGDQAGPEPAKMLLKIDEREVKVIDVPVPRTQQKIYEEKVSVRAGRHRIAAAFINDYYNPQAPNPRERDRNLIIDYVDVVGPVDVKPPEPPESHERIFVAKPDAVKSKHEAAAEIVKALAARAFRRPVAAEEVEKFTRLFDLADKQGDSFEGAMKLPLSAILVSPHFLFRVERDQPGGDAKDAHRVNDWELASRLSYFLWSTMPDGELFECARLGTLRDPKVLEGQVGRMLRDPRSKALAENFAIQWLQLRRLETHAVDAKRFPQFGDRLREAMRRETESFFDAVLREDRSVLTILDANFTYVNEALAKHYAIEGVKGDEMRRVELADARRGGVLTMASVLTVTSNPARTSPVKRGKWVLETILGTPPPPPAPDAGELKEEAGGAHTMTVRQRLERHRADPNCASCHQRMDPIGFAYENYDAIGAWRDREDDLSLDVTGTLKDGRSFNGAVEFKKAMLAKKDDFVRTLTGKMFTYALGRGVEYYDGPVLKEIRKGLVDHDYRISVLVQGIVQSYPFQYRRNRASEVKDE